MYFFLMILSVIWAYYVNNVNVSFLHWVNEYTFCKYYKVNSTSMNFYPFISWITLCSILRQFFLLLLCFFFKVCLTNFPLIFNLKWFFPPFSAISLILFFHLTSMVDPSFVFMWKMKDFMAPQFKIWRNW